MGFGVPLRMAVSLSLALKAVVSRFRRREAIGRQYPTATLISTEAVQWRSRSADSELEITVDEDSRRQFAWL